MNEEKQFVLLLNHLLITILTLYVTILHVTTLHNTTLKYTNTPTEAKGFITANKRKEKLINFYNSDAIVENALL